MGPRTAILIGLALFGGVAFAATRRSAVGAVDAPDLTSGDWGPLPIFEDLADMVGGTFVSQQSLSYAGLQQLKDEEGFSATPYPDHKGNSIGYGHLIKPGENLTYVTTSQAEELLLSDVDWAERAVRTAVKVPLTVGQFDSLVLLAYNIGEGAFKASTLVRKLNAGDYAGAAAEFPRWVRAGGQVNSTLVARRHRERVLFEG